MINLIKKILNNLKNISAYKIKEVKTVGNELFFIKKDIHMERLKTVNKFIITVYKDFEENDTLYRGSSTCNIYPTMTQDEIQSTLENAAFSASFVKNKYFPLVNKSILRENVTSKFSSDSLQNWMNQLTKVIYKYDIEKNGGINSCELFLNKNNIRILNSEGLDVKYTKFNGFLEFITNWKENQEEIELFKTLEFSDFDEDLISNSVKNMIKISKEKALAIDTLKTGNYNVLFSYEPVKTIFSFYKDKSNARSIYEKTSDFKTGENIQGKNVKGDLISLTLDPYMENSTASSPYDEDGYPLSKLNIIKDGVLNCYHGDIKYSHYLNIVPTGAIDNMIIDGGSKSIDELKKEPYVELVSFSDFQMNSLTGDFGGEIRLGWYFDGTKTTPITGGSVSGNINILQENMLMSKETQKVNNFIGPKTIKFSNISISGK